MRHMPNSDDKPVDTEQLLARVTVACERGQDEMGMNPHEMMWLLQREKRLTAACERALAWLMNMAQTKSRRAIADQLETALGVEE